MGANASGAKVGEVRYKAWGEERYVYGATPTTYRYTGQRWESGIGLYFYNARWYDPALGRFVQPDTVVPEPGDPQELNRFSYARNAPINYTDPSGHAAEAGLGAGICDYEDLAREYERAAGQVSTEAYGGWLQEYMARNAVRYKALAEFGAAPENPNVAAYIEDLGSGVAWAKERLLVNGYAGRDVALDTAYRSGGGTGLFLEFAAVAIGAVGKPGGRLGGPEHQARVKEIKDNIESKGLKAKTEFPVETPGGEKVRRFVDVAALDPVSGQPVEFYQVGNAKSNGFPVAREMRAIQDILNHSDVPLWFYPK